MASGPSGGTPPRQGTQDRSARAVIAVLARALERAGRSRDSALHGRAGCDRLAVVVAEVAAFVDEPDAAHAETVAAVAQRFVTRHPPVVAQSLDAVAGVVAGPAATHVHLRRLQMHPDLAAEGRAAVGHGVAAPGHVEARDAAAFGEVAGARLADLTGMPHDEVAVAAAVAGVGVGDGEATAGERKAVAHGFVHLDAADLKLRPGDAQAIAAGAA